MSGPLHFPQSPDDLERLFTLIWEHLETASAAQDHPWRLTHLATQGDHGPEPRVVVLRDVSKQSHEIFVHTDLRTPKIQQLRNTPQAAWLFYDREERAQLIVKGEATIHHDDSFADEQWQKADAFSRKLYLAAEAPGTPSPFPTVNLPLEFRDRLPTLEETEAGRQNFAVLRSKINSMDLVLLRQNGNFRCQFVNQESVWQGTWLSP